VTQPENISADLHQALHAHVVQVEFKKADGSLRVMTATLMEAHLPGQKQDAPESQGNNQLFKVWDLDKESWRSFRADRLQSWKILS
jgi:hypothetical protein